MKTSNCRFCSTPLKHTFINLGCSPLANSFLDVHALHEAELFFPLHVYVCSTCFLVQLEEFESPAAIFSEYAYFSSYSKSWLAHCEAYVEMITKKLKLDSENQVIEIASNDGYLLKYFKQKKIPILGIEPAKNIAESAIKIGIPTEIAFFDENAAEILKSKDMMADLILGNNVFAHVPNINSFVKGLKTLLKKNGTITLEFPHLLELIKNNQFDTIYHEHFSYLSLLTTEKIFNEHGLNIYDVDELETHGGSIRIYAKHAEDQFKPESKRLIRLRENENNFGLNKTNTYDSFSNAVKNVKYDLLKLLIALKQKGKSIVAYGAPAKGNTLLNYCGIKSEFLDYAVDMSTYKQGKYLPGSRIPILHPKTINETKPDYLLILPWNIKSEVMIQMSHIRTWGGKFIIPIPYAEVVE